MNDELTEHERNLRDLYAGFAMIGLIMKGEKPHEIPTKAFLYADEMTQARVPQPTGIVSVKAKPKKEKANEQTD